MLQAEVLCCQNTAVQYHSYSSNGLLARRLVRYFRFEVMGLAEFRLSAIVLEFGENVQKKVFIDFRDSRRYTAYTAVFRCAHLLQSSMELLSFYSFPTDVDLRKRCLVNIRRDDFSPTSNSKVCSKHYSSDQISEPQTPEAWRKLVTGAVPVLFTWNDYTVKALWPGVFERRERPAEVVSVEPVPMDVTMDHDYCRIPEPSSLNLACAKVEELSNEVEELKKRLHEPHVPRDFGLEWFTGSDEDISFYTRFPSYRHLMSFCHSTQNHSCFQI